KPCSGEMAAGVAHQASDRRRHSPRGAAHPVAGRKRGLSDFRAGAQGQDAELTPCIRSERLRGLAFAAIRNSCKNGSMNATVLPDPAFGTATAPRDALGRPMRDLRISLLDRCNFRCPYCMPESEFNADYQFLRKPELLTHAEILKIATVAV